jgi:hypothetical protein
VTLESLGAAKFSSTGGLETFSCAAIGFEFRHSSSRMLSVPTNKCRKISCSSMFVKMFLVNEVIESGSADEILAR